MPESKFAKDVSGFVELAGSLEAPLYEQTGFLTPNERFFVCNAGDTPRVDLGSWRLTVNGDGVRGPLELSHDDLSRMTQCTVPALLECAGNHRMLFNLVLGQKLDKRPDMTEVLWTLGGVGMAEWRGVPLRDVLELAGIRRNAVHVCPVGLDRDSPEGAVQCPMPVAKAVDPNTLIALQMNGVPLPPDHGYPARVVVPGWLGTYSIKWVGRIIVSTDHIWVKRNTEMYVLMGPDWPPERYRPARGAPIFQQTIKSSLALPWPAHLATGRHRVRGYARSPDSRISVVQWSADRGATWQTATLQPPNLRYAWVQFSFEWEASPGLHAVMTRAIDESGRTQPLSIPFNDGGYVFNMVHPHPVFVEPA